MSFLMALVLATASGSADVGALSVAAPGGVLLHHPAQVGDGGRHVSRCYQRRRAPLRRPQAISSSRAIMAGAWRT